MYPPVGELCLQNLPVPLHFRNSIHSNLRPKAVAVFKEILQNKTFKKNY